VAGVQAPLFLVYLTQLLFLLEWSKHRVGLVIKFTSASLNRQGIICWAAVTPTAVQLLIRLVELLPQPQLLNYCKHGVLTAVDCSYTFILFSIVVIYITFARNMYYVSDYLETLLIFETARLLYKLKYVLLFCIKEL